MAANLVDTTNIALGFLITHRQLASCGMGIVSRKALTAGLALLTAAAAGEKGNVMREQRI